MKTMLARLGIFGAVVLGTAFLLQSCGKSDTTGPDSGTTPPEKGVALGVATTVPIGAAGGVASTSDGSVSVAIPAGALSSTSQIGVQPITNSAPMGFGVGVRFTPDGLKFAGPATVTFNFAGGPPPGSAPSLSVAFQDSSGGWQSVGGSAVDTTQQSVAFTTTHFSDYVLFERFRLVADRKAVLEGETVQFTAVRVGPDNLSPLAGGTRLTGATAVDGSLVTLWRLNGVAPPGTAADGQLVVGTDKSRGTYTAPAIAPAGGAVGVSCQISALGGTRGIPLAVRLTVGSSVSFQFGRDVERTIRSFWFDNQPVVSIGGSDTALSVSLVLPSKTLGAYAWSAATSISIASVAPGRVSTSYVTSYTNSQGVPVLMPGAVWIRAFDSAAGVLRGEFAGTMARIVTVGNQSTVTPVVVTGRFAVRKSTG